jgi:oligopeptide transport system ATP-binding protein
MHLHEEGADKNILSVHNLRTCFRVPGGTVKAVDGVSISLMEKETLGLVGESGCGKSVTALSVLGLIPQPPGSVSSDGIFFEGRDIARLSKKELRKIRGNKISMIFQEPMTSLNPVFTIGYQMAEAIILHKGIRRKEAMEQSVEMLDRVGIPLARQRLKEHPHQLSGGMRQRVMIAMALSCNPKILLADEPTTALDVTIQAQILDLMRQLRDETGTAIVLISHNLGLVAETCQRVIVMYAGKIIEEAPVEEIFAKPAHPYTIGLLHSLPRLRTSSLEGKRTRLEAIPGVVPSLHRLPKGCRFNPRCTRSSGICSKREPPALEVQPGHHVCCWLFGNETEEQGRNSRS